MVSPGSYCLLVCSFLLPSLSGTSHSVHTLQPTSSVVLYFVQNWGYIQLLCMPLLPNSHPHLLMVYPVPTNNAKATSHSGVTVSSGMEETPTQNIPVQKLQVATYHWTYLEEILTTSKSHMKKSYRLFL